MDHVEAVHTGALIRLIPVPISTTLPSFLGVQQECNSHRLFSSHNMLLLPSPRDKHRLTFTVMGAPVASAGYCQDVSSLAATVCFALKVANLQKFS